jgi:hypothetical protein
MSLCSECYKSAIHNTWRMSRMCTVAVLSNGKGTTRWKLAGFVHGTWDMRYRIVLGFPAGTVHNY